MIERYLIAPTAKQDLDEIIGYIAQDNRRAAAKMLEIFFNAMERIANYPQIGHQRHDLTIKPVRFWLVKNHYLIIYKVTNPIEIVRILSSYRDISKLLINQ